MKKITISKCILCDSISDQSTMYKSDLGLVCKACYEKRKKCDNQILTLLEIILDNYGVHEVDRAGLMRQYADKMEYKYGMRFFMNMKGGDLN